MFIVVTKQLYLNVNVNKSSKLRCFVSFNVDQSLLLLVKKNDFLCIWNYAFIVKHINVLKKWMFDTTLIYFYF